MGGKKKNKNRGQNSQNVSEANKSGNADENLQGAVGGVEEITSQNKDEKPDFIEDGSTKLDMQDKSDKLDERIETKKNPSDETPSLENPVTNASHKEVGDTEEKKEKTKETNEASEEDDEIDDEGITVELLDGPGRDALYERGMALLDKDKTNKALRCFLTCLTGLQETQSFRFLPQCLHQVADIYFKKEEFEKAVQFIQAEKMFYETTLIDVSQLEKQIEKKTLEATGDGIEDKPEAIRADEYEKLARMCLDQNKPCLALEYQGKATKLRQNLYGDDHPIVLKSLDFFTVVYAEVGKQQYTASMQKYKDPVPPSPSTPDGGGDSVQNAPSSILRNRKVNRTPSEEERHVTFNEEPIRRTYEQEVEAREVKDQEEWISQSLLIILFMICGIALSVIFVYVFCKMDVNSRTCASWKSDLQYYYMKFKYFFYQYILPSKNVYG